MNDARPPSLRLSIDDATLSMRSRNRLRNKLRRQVKREHSRRRVVRRETNRLGDDPVWRLARRATYAVIGGAILGVTFGVFSFSPQNGGVGVAPLMEGFDMAPASDIGGPVGPAALLELDDARSRPRLARLETETPTTEEVGAEPIEPFDAAPEAPISTLRATPSRGGGTWRDFAAAPSRVEPDQPLIAIIMDDMGPDQSAAERVVALPAPLTLAFLPYADDLQVMADAARSAGHEVLLHLPMEPEGNEDPGEMALTLSLSADELKRRLNWSLNRFTGYVGVNNHMGSRFTADMNAMRVVLEDVRRRGLLFLDSKTSPDSVGEQLARAMGAPAASRDVFLDHPADDRLAVRRELAKLERIAREQGYAIAIAHPRPDTLAVLSPWIVSAPARGFTLAPLSQIYDLRSKRNRRFAARAAQ